MVKEEMKEMLKLTTNKIRETVKRFKERFVKCQMELLDVPEPLMIGERVCWQITYNVPSRSTKAIAVYYLISEKLYEVHCTFLNGRKRTAKSINEMLKVVEYSLNKALKHRK